MSACPGRSAEDGGQAGGVGREAQKKRAGASRPLEPDSGIGSKKKHDSDVHDKNKQIRQFRDEVEQMMIAIEAMRNDRSKASTPHKPVSAR
eukprot:1197913-Rhodomonas_salina.3